MSKLITLESTALEQWVKWIAADTCTNQEGAAALAELKRIGFPGVEELLRIVPESWAYSVKVPECTSCGESTTQVVRAADRFGDVYLCESCVDNLAAAFKKK